MEARPLAPGTGVPRPALRSATMGRPRLEEQRRRARQSVGHAAASGMGVGMPPGPRTATWAANHHGAPPRIIAPRLLSPPLVASPHLTLTQPTIAVSPLFAAPHLADHRAQAQDESRTAVGMALSSRGIPKFEGKELYA